MTLSEDIEMVEIYTIDENGKPIYTGKIQERSSPLAENEFLLGVSNWIVNSKGEFLMQKRSASKKENPNKWASTGGARLVGEPSLDACIRETKEELSLALAPEELTYVDTVKRHALIDVFVTKKEVDLSTLVLQKEEVSEVRWVSLETIASLVHNNEITPGSATILDKAYDYLAKAHFDLSNIKKQ